MVVGPNVRDFGTVLQAEKMSANFTLRNTSASPITIVETVRSCGCTVARFGALELGPGETTWAAMTLETGSNRGDITSTTEILYRAGGPETGPPVALTLKARVRPDYEVSPLRLTFGPGLPNSQTLLVRPGVLQDLQITRVVVSGRCLEIRLRKEQAEGGRTVEVVYRSDLHHVDEPARTLMLETNSRRAAKYSVPVVVRRTPPTPPGP